MREEFVSLHSVMSLYIASLNSGSNGNCYYIGNETEAILVDAGLSCKETEKRMMSLGLSLGKVKAVFVSHEHSDHIKGLEVISRKYQLPVFISQKTLTNSSLQLHPALVQPFSTDASYGIGSLQIVSFSKYHDAAEPCSFLVKNEAVTVGVFTDLGNVCQNLVHHFKQCHAAFLEANYDEAMLENGHYPYYLKKRIRGGRGHLSNKEALDLFLQHKSTQLRHVLLSHLSRENNCPELATNLFRSMAGNVSISVASRYEHSPLLHITAETPVQIPSRQLKPQQLALF